MEARKVVVVACALSICSLANARGLGEYSESELFRSYALSLCLAKEYKGERIHQDAVSALNGFRDAGRTGLSAYHALNALYVDWKRQPFLTKEGRDLPVARCIDFSLSAEVSELLLKDMAR